MPSSLKTLNQYANIIAGEPEEAKLKRLNAEKHLHTNKNINTAELKKERNNFEFLFDNDEKKDHNRLNEEFLDEKPKNENVENKIELKEEVLVEEVIEIKEETKVAVSKPISTNLTRKKKS